MGIYDNKGIFGINDGMPFFVVNIKKSGEDPL